MTQRSWGIACAVAHAVALSVVGPLVVSAEDAANLAAQHLTTDRPSIVGLEALPGVDETTVRIETTAESLSYISYSRDDRTLVVDLYGLEIAGGVPDVLDVGSGEIERIRLEAAGDGSARFVIERSTPGVSLVRVRGSTLVVEARAQPMGSGPVGVGPAPQPVPAAMPAAGWPTAQPATALAQPGRVRLGPATRIERIQIEPRGGDLRVRIHGDGELRYRAFPLAGPPRLVVDFFDVVEAVPERAYAVGHEAVRRIRVAQFQGAPDRVARVVFDLDADQPYRVDARNGAVDVSFALDLAALDRLAAEAAAADGDSAIGDSATGDSATGDSAAGDYADGGVAEAAQGAPPSLPGEALTEAVEFDAEPDYIDDDEGILISLDLKDADIKDVLRYFSEISGLNVILDPAVSGTITVRLIDVPWNKALDIILKAHGYGKTLDGNVLRIADIGKLTREEAQAADFIRNKEEARPLVTFTKAVSYADPQDIRQLVQKTALSSKGSIELDDRTGTLVITEVDIPEYHKRILDLIKELDVPTPQVEIEARVVETSKNFTRSFGLQWGFNHIFDTFIGNTTDFTFPNSGLIAGDLITGSGFESLLPNTGWAVNLPASGANAAVGFTLANITDSFQLDVVLSGLEDDGKVRLLSAPRITTQSNRQARINSGLQIPVQTVSNNTITTTFVNADLSLDVTPQVTADNTVILDVTVGQGSPDLGVAIGPGATPPINRRTAKTILMVADGGTAVIGGVFQLNESTSANRIPVFHQLPFIGWLFKNKTDRRSNNELLIFITPKIKRF